MLSRNSKAKELNQLRFSDSRQQQQDQGHAEAGLEIDVANLPDLLITAVENLIKKERPEIVDCTENSGTLDKGWLDLILGAHYEQKCPSGADLVKKFQCKI